MFTLLKKNSLNSTTFNFRLEKAIVRSPMRIKKNQTKHFLMFSDRKCKKK